MNFKTITVFTIFVFLLTGCWDRREINDIAFVLATAIDKQGEQYKSLIQIALPGQMGGAGSQGGGGGTSGGKSWYIESKTADTIRDTVIREQQQISRRVYFAHRRVIIFGKNLAREGLSPAIDVLARIPQNRLSAYVVVSPEEVEKVLQTDAPIEKFPAEMIRELVGDSMNHPRELRHLSSMILSEGIDPAIPMISVGKTTPNDTGKESKTTVRLHGLAIFRDDKLAGFMEGDEAESVLWAMNEAKNSEITVAAPEGNGKITVEFQKVRANLLPQINGNNISMRINIRARGTVIENSSDWPLMGGSQMKLLENKLQEKVESSVRKAVQKLQKDYRSDCIGFGKTIYNTMPSEWHKISKYWDSVYPKIDTTIHVDIHIEHNGTLIKPLGIKEGRLSQ